MAQSPMIWKPGFAVDDHRRGKVPVATREVVIDVGTDNGHTIEGFLHRVEPKRIGIEIDERDW